MTDLERVRKSYKEFKKMEKTPGGTVYIAKYLEDVGCLLDMIGERKPPKLPERPKLKK